MTLRVGSLISSELFKIHPILPPPKRATQKRTWKTYHFSTIRNFGYHGTISRYQPIKPISVLFLFFFSNLPVCIIYSALNTSPLIEGLFSSTMNPGTTPSLPISRPFLLFFIFLAIEPRPYIVRQTQKPTHTRGRRAQQGDHSAPMGENRKKSHKSTGHRRILIDRISSWKTRHEWKAAGQMYLTMYARSSRLICASRAAAVFNLQHARCPRGSQIKAVPRDFTSRTPVPHSIGTYLSRPNAARTITACPVDRVPIIFISQTTRSDGRSTRFLPIVR